MSVLLFNLKFILFLHSIHPLHSFVSKATFVHFENHFQQARRPQLSHTLACVEKKSVTPTSTTVNSTSPKSVSKELRPCYYKSAFGKWKVRLELDDLSIGQELSECRVVQELLDAKRGPKIFCDCGVGRTRDGQNWKIVNAVLRLDRKVSVARKRTARLRSRSLNGAGFVAFVSRLRPDNDQFEVCLSKEEALNNYHPKKPAVSSLKIGQEVIGMVTRLEHFGVLVDVGVARPGLLHIKTIADLVGKFVSPTPDGLKKVGIERGAQVRLKVASTERKRLFLDFTDEAKKEAEQDKLERKRKKNDKLGLWSSEKLSVVDAARNTLPSVSSGNGLCTTPPLPAYANLDNFKSKNSSRINDTTSEDKFDEVDTVYATENDYDEDRDIEDALGLGRY